MIQRTQSVTATFHCESMGSLAGTAVAPVRSSQRAEHCHTVNAMQLGLLSHNASSPIAPCGDVGGRVCPQAARLGKISCTPKHALTLTYPGVMRYLFYSGTGGLRLFRILCVAGRALQRAPPVLGSRPFFRNVVGGELQAMPLRLSHIEITDITISSCFYLRVQSSSMMCSLSPLLVSLAVYATVPHGRVFCRSHLPRTSP